ncbi:hypothetical protein [Breznakiella homolactica]|uniref:Tetratricopeptide repeat protein n=1 Tax=Breznakiella homolactica TaxID=2798577 RepID=A0A7T7XMR5_9SPIR|nr:hypothetical protein [Breznakiella homolactica]QQO09210.1 hypothetical protein JFL75_20140 [Breznakiella homolactica]
MKKKPCRIQTIGFLLFAAFSLAACSSAPKRPAEVFTVRNMADTQLEQANREADRGNYEGALGILGDVQRLGAATDDPALRIRVNLSLGNVLFYLGQHDAAAAAWNAAGAEALREDQDELAALTEIYVARSRLLSAGLSAASAGDTLTVVEKAMGRIKNRQYTALGWTVAGMAQKAMGRYPDAEASVKKALDIHGKDNYLEQAAYDWYLIASIRSVAGNYSSALEALREAVRYDRRAENSHGLGMDWRALGDVYAKMNNSTEADAAYRRSAEIFRSIFLEEEAARSEDRISGV